MGRQNDGSLFFDTQVDTGGFEEGQKKLEKLSKNGSSSIEQDADKVNKKIQQSADEAASAAKKSTKEIGDAAKKSADEVAKHTQKVMNDQADVVGGINKATKGMAAGLVAAGGAVLGMGVAYNSEIEQYTAGFTTMLGSAEKADEMLGNLKSFAEKTPFEMSDLASASTTLLAFGENVDELMPDLKMLGDISLGNKEKFNGLALVFGQVKSQGKLMGQDLLQMINQGFNPLQVISEKTGESMASLKDKMSKGQISFEMVADAMRIATSEGGQFYNAMETQSKTFTGQVSTLKDNISSLFGEMSEGISEKLTDDILPDAIEMVEELKLAWEDGRLQEALSLAASGAAGFGAAVAALNIILIANDLVQLKKGAEGYTAATKLGTAAQKLFNAEMLKNPYTALAVGLAALAAGVITYAATHESAAKKIGEAHDEAIKSIEENASAEKAQAQTAVVLKDRLFELEEQIKSGTLSEAEAKAAQDEFNSSADQLGKLIPEITDALYDETGAIDVQRGSVEALTTSYVTLANAKAMASAYQSKIDETAKSLVEVEEALKPYNTGEKEKYFSGKNFMGEYLAPNKEYKALVTQREKLNKELEGYIYDLGEYEKKIAEESAKTTKKIEEKKTGYVSSGNKSRTESTKKASAEELNILKTKLKEGEISEEQYYTELERLRDKYFTKGSDEWLSYTEQIYDYQKKALEAQKKDIEALYTDVADHATKKIEEVISKQEAYQKKLNSFSNLFDVNTVHMGDDTFTYYTMHDFSKDTALINEFSENVETLKNRLSGLGIGEDVISQYMSEFDELDMTTAMQFIKGILSGSDIDLLKNVEGYALQRETSKKASTQHYAPELEKAVEGSIEYMKEKLQEAGFTDIPEDFFVSGQISAQKFGEAFAVEIEKQMEEIRSKIAAFNASLNVNLNGFSIIPSAGNNTTNNSYSSTYNLVAAAGESTTQQLQNIRNNEMLERMRGGY